MPSLLFLHLSNFMRVLTSKNKPTGFTLIELLLYVGMAGSLLLLTSLFLSLLLQAKVKNQTIAEVEQQGLLLSQHISQVVRNSQSVSSPTPGTSATSLVVDVVDPLLDPTTLVATSGVVTIATGLNGPVPLTNNRVTISDLIFENLSRSGASDIIRVSFTISYINNNGRNEYSYEKSFITSATVRQH